MYLITKWFGIFLCDKNGIRKKILFPKDPEKIADILLKIDENKVLPEERLLSKDVNIIINEKRLKRIGNYKPDDTFFKKKNINPEKFDFSHDLLQKTSLILAEIKVKQKLKSKDLQIIQMVNALDDLIQTSNLLTERLNCWSVIPTPKYKIKPFQKILSVIKNEIKRLENQIENDVEKLAKNTSKIIGPLISARLISLAGGMERLAYMPASTIQLLGAEKALFRFKKEGGKPPKHGIIFQHPLINKSPKANRGKIARVIATKISIAIKADVFTKRDIHDILKEDLKIRINNIKNQ
jgi:nucleolar protein 56